jgi:predicted flap endonuclease-1-like 5' DNA nuclease
LTVERALFSAQDDVMNSGSYALEPISQDGVLITIALGLIAVLAILTVIAMIWGAKLKRQRKAAEADEQDRIESLKADGVEVTETAEGASSVVAERASDRTSMGRSEPETETHVTRPALADQPIPAAAPLDATPASVAADAPVEETPGTQSVSVLKGLGPKIATRLEELGITRIDQLAWLDDGEAGQLDAQLGAFQGRMERDRWREQARLLAKGDRTAYEAQFGKLG